MTFPPDIIEERFARHLCIADTGEEIGWTEYMELAQLHMAFLKSIGWPASAAVKEEREACAKVILAAEALIATSYDEGLAGIKGVGVQELLVLQGAVTIYRSALATEKETK